MGKDTELSEIAKEIHDGGRKPKSFYFMGLPNEVSAPAPKLTPEEKEHKIITTAFKIKD